MNGRAFNASVKTLRFIVACHQRNQHSYPLRFAFSSQRSQQSLRNFPVPFAFQYADPVKICAAARCVAPACDDGSIDSPDYLIIFNGNKRHGSIEPCIIKACFQLLSVAFVRFPIICIPADIHNFHRSTSIFRHCIWNKWALIISFVVLGNYGLGLQFGGRIDAVAIYESTGDIYGTVIEIIRTLPLYPIVLILIVLSMVAFYASSFDSITLVACQYSYRESTGMEASSKQLRLFWAIFLILLPIALIFSEGSMNNLQTVSIIAAFPIGIVILLIIAAFIKDAKSYIRELSESRLEH